jgi:hypothetical protein
VDTEKHSRRQIRKWFARCCLGTLRRHLDVVAVLVHAVRLQSFRLIIDWSVCRNF